MGERIRVGILFGGKSAEHEVSLQSAKSILDAIDHEKYEVVMLGIDKSGRWYLGDPSNAILNADNPERIRLGETNDAVALVPGKSGKSIVQSARLEPLDRIDVIFPILHGTYGEDGTVQGMLKLADVAFVGASVLGSAVCMDKDVSKRLLREAGVPIGRFKCALRHTMDQLDFDRVAAEFGLPLFVKPANLGSSVGIHRIHNGEEYRQAIRDAFRFDNKILIEENIEGREIECAVLGNEAPIASVPGEVIPQHGFYSYQAKYIDENGATLDIPAKIAPAAAEEVRTLAVRVFKTLCCEGMARVDFFLKHDGTIVVNELNSIPGFTAISMYPKLWEESGIPYRELIDRLLQLAIERHNRDRELRTDYSS